MEIKISQNEVEIDIVINGYNNNVRKYVCLVMAIVLAIIGLIGAYYLLIDDNYLLAIIPISIFFYLSYGYYDGFIWNKKGEERLHIDLKKGIFYKKGISKFFSKEFTIDDSSIVKKYNAYEDGDDLAPRSDGYIGAYGGDIIFKLKNSSFRFGKNLTEDDTQYIIQSVNNYLKVTNSVSKT